MLCNCAIPLGLQIYINNRTILANCPPKGMLLTIDLHEDFIEVEGVALAKMSPPPILPIPFG